MDMNSAIVLSRLSAQQRAMDVTATNIANANTPGYQAERTVFADWLARGTGGESIAYTQDRATWRDTRQGSLTHTGNPLDVALSADGYFQVQTAAGVRLTRAGHFALAASGGLVDSLGNPVLDSNNRPIQFAPADTNISIAGDGTISSQNGQIGRLGIVSVADPHQLKAEGGRLLDPSGTSTAPVANPRLTQGAVEGSNIEPTRELTRMMADLREFQFASQFIQAEADRQQGAIDKITQQRS
jgi:flagellar basal-body rod protein FlgF